MHQIQELQPRACWAKNTARVIVLIIVLLTPSPLLDLLLVFRSPATCNCSAVGVVINWCMDGTVMPNEMLVIIRSVITSTQFLTGKCAEKHPGERDEGNINR